MLRRMHVVLAALLLASVGPAPAPTAPAPPPGDCADRAPPAVVDDAPREDAAVDVAPWLIGGGFATSALGAAVFLLAHGGAVATTAMAGAPLSIVATVAIPVVGPMMSIAQAGGVPDEFMPVAVGVFAAQAAGLALVVGGASLGAIGVGAAALVE